MTDRNERIDRAARAFVEAAATLAEELLGKLGEESPGRTADVAAALDAGERMMLYLEFHPEEPAIRWSTIDDYQHMKRIMTIPAAMPSRH